MKIDKKDLIIALVLVLYHRSTDHSKHFEGSVRLRYSTSTKARRIEHEY